jgi:hypothetical protein
MKMTKGRTLISAKKRTFSTKVPVDFAATRNNEGWRERVAWPISLNLMLDQSRAFYQAYHVALTGMSDEEMRNAALLGGPTAVSICIAIADLAVALAAAEYRNWELVGGGQEIVALRSKEPLTDIWSRQLQATFKPMATPNFTPLRRLARVASWAGNVRAPIDTFFSQTEAISHNSSLIAAARMHRQRLGFRHAEVLLAQARQKIAPAHDRESKVKLLSAIFVQALLSTVPVEGRYQERLAEVATSTCSPIFTRAFEDLNGISNVTKLPVDIWSSTGGYWPARCVGLEVLRRGGQVRRFEHVAVASTLSVNEPLALTELSVSSTFVLSSPGQVKILEATGVKNLVSSYRQIELVANTVQSAPKPTPRRQRSRSAKRCVVYAPTILRGSRQFVPPKMTDPLYLDWQFRLVEALMAFDINLRIRPHPEGLLRGQPQPLDTITLTEQQSFEALIPDADVFVFDTHQSSTFFAAACTNRPIVFLDFGIQIFNEPTLRVIEQRCHIIKLQFDELQRPILDAGELEDAVLTIEAEQDPTQFNELFGMAT